MEIKQAVMWKYLNVCYFTKEKGAKFLIYRLLEQVLQIFELKIVSLQPSELKYLIYE